MWSIARRVCVLFHDIGNSSIRIGPAHDGDGAAAAAARDPSAVKTGVRTGGAYEMHDQIRPAGTQTTRRVTRVRLIHEFAETPEFGFVTRIPQQIARSEEH